MKKSAKGGVPIGADRDPTAADISADMSVCSWRSGEWSQFVLIHNLAMHASPFAGQKHESERSRFGNLEGSVRSAGQHCVRTVADLIEAELNEDAGRFAVDAMGFV